MSATPSPDGAARLRLRMRWDQTVRSGRPAQLRVAVLASFTAQPLAPYLGVALEDAAPAEIWVGPYNQIAPQCLSAESELAHFGPDLLVVWPRLEELWGGELPLDGDVAAQIDDAAALAEACAGAATRLGARLLFVLPAVPELRPLGLGDAGSPRAVAATAAAVRESLRGLLAGRQGVLLLDAEDLVRTVGAARAYNRRMQAVARIPFSEEVFHLAGQRMARLLAQRPAPRLLVIEPDNVLWGGALAELGPSGVDVAEGGPGELHRQIQAFLLEQRRAGNRLAICGDHAKASLREVLARREMLLRREHLVGWQTDPRPCAALRALAEDTRTALADVVLITASAACAAAVAAQFPEVALVQLPEDAAEWLDAFQSSPALDMPPRAAAPVPSPAAQPRAAKPTLADFLARLALKVDVAPAEPHELAQVVHLTHHTSEFHLTGEQYDQAALEAFLAQPGAECWLIRVSDRLGDYGDAGALLLRAEGGTLDVATFLLNCRVLGRNVEYEVLRQLATIASERGCAQVRLLHRPTERNAVAGAFVRAVGGQPAPEGGASATLTPAQLAALAPQGQAPSSCGADLPAPRPSAVAPAARFLAARAARLGEAGALAVAERFASFQRGEQLLEAVQAYRRRSRPDMDVAYVAPRTPLEGQLADVWGEVLGLDRIGVRDNFFHLGGHSILATQLVMRLYDVLGIELPVRIFFETPTIESMSQAIDIVRRTGDDTAFIAEAPEYVKAEAVLDPSITAEGARPAEHTSDPRRIFLTGGTGYLGAFLLAELLRRTSATIYCHARARDEQDALARLAANLQHYGLWDEAQRHRLVPVVGDLAQPLLGLSEERFLELADLIDVIYHAGAITSFIYPYTTLKPTNVLGTQEVLRLASRIRLKPVHLTSTLYVFGPGDKHEDGGPMREDDIPEHVETMHIGYRQSKWVAERLLLLARERGIPVAIYRPSRIAGHSHTGACQTNDFVWRMIRACIDASSVFNQDMTMDMVPVDYVSEAIVHLSLRPESLNQVFHLTNPKVPRLDEIVEWSQSYGYPIRREPYETWRARLKVAAELSNQNASFALVPFLPQDLSRQQLGDLPFDASNTLAGLAGSGIACPLIDETRFHVYLDYFTQSGFLRTPQEVGAVLEEAGAA